jgi:predicted ATP-grasp superfamily ATP-dependent carboligase
MYVKSGGIVLYNRLKLVADVPKFENPVLIYGFTGFLEAGHAVRIATEHVLASVEHEVVAEFDLDAIYDYRARRPRLSFATDHYTGAELPSLVISACRDERGAGFFVLNGVEPDFGWQSVIKDVVTFVREVDISLSVSLLAVPFPSPHTRPVAVTAHANRPELLKGRRSWLGDMEVPASMAGLLEFTLGQGDLPAMGFVAHVPHYLANLNHPASALALIRELSLATGLLLPTDSLREAAREADEELAEQLQASPENMEGIHQLEAQYDALAAERSGDADGTATPITADDIAAQVEQFLAQMESRGKGDE